MLEFLSSEWRGGELILSQGGEPSEEERKVCILVGDVGRCDWIRSNQWKGNDLRYRGCFRVADSGEAEPGGLLMAGDACA